MCKIVSLQKLMLQKIRKSTKSQITSVLYILAVDPHDAREYKYYAIRCNI